MSSNAVAQSRIAAVVGYLIAKGSFQAVSPNLPQRLAILCEANTANQGTLDLTPFQASNAQQVGARYGYGSPAYLIARILMPLYGGGLDGIPALFYPQAQAVGATPKSVTIQPAGVATGNATHTVIIGGRNNVDSSFYDIQIATNDTIATITSKITNVVNSVLGSPVTASDNTYINTLTTKWSGATANDLVVSVDTKNNPVGISYGITTASAGVGTPSVSPALALFGADWNTIVINSYGLNTSVMSTLEAFNGTPDNTNPTGRYQGIVMKPFIALSGSTLADPSSITDTRLNDVTISVSAAPNSAAFPFEAAANDALLFALCAQNTPELDILNSVYPDMPAATVIGAMSDYNNRDLIVKKGCSTVDLSGGLYKVKDPVTTYHPLGENPPQFRYRRDIMVDLNIRYGYFLLERQYVLGKVIANDADIVNTNTVIKPKQWKQILADYFTQLVQRGLIVDANFSLNSLVVNISVANPNRFETTFNIKRSGVARISSTTAVMGFNFGTLNS